MRVPCCKKSPILWPILNGNGNRNLYKIRFSPKTACSLFKQHIGLDRHRPRPGRNICHLPDTRSKIRLIQNNVKCRYLNKLTCKGRVSSKQTKLNFGSNRNKPKQDMFRFVSWNQKLKISVCFGLFWCFKPISKQLKQTELFRNKTKQP